MQPYTYYMHMGLPTFATIIHTHVSLYARTSIDNLSRGIERMNLHTRVHYNIRTFEFPALNKSGAPFRAVRREYILFLTRH
jgi:hypothetical protein